MKLGSRGPRTREASHSAPRESVLGQAVGASGLRPLAAYSIIGAVLLAVAGKAVWIHTATAGEQPSGLRGDHSPWPGFELVDCVGRPLALSVECFDLTASPRALWRSHTPLRMAEAIAQVLGDQTTDAVLARLMPEAFSDGIAVGWLEAFEPRLLALDEAGAERARRWLATGEPTPDDERIDVSIEGFQLVPLLGSSSGREPGLWTLAWEPAVALADRERVRHLGDGGEKRPERWTRRLLDGLLGVVGGEQAALAKLPAEARDSLALLRGLELRGALHDALWAELMPSRFRVVARRVDAARAHELARLFGRESVSPWQIDVHSRLERKHPTRPDGEPAAPSAERTVTVPEDAFALLGHWGVLDPGTARRVAKRTRDDRPYLLPWEDPIDPLEAYTQDLQREWRPWSGLELRVQLELENGPWNSLLDDHSRGYERRLRSVARDRRDAWKKIGRLPDYFERAHDAAEVPRVHATLDAQVQEMLHSELGHALQTHRAALTMGIVVDVQSGDVLGLDYCSRYPYSGFAPLRHVFTPGSTFKAIVMAVALDRGYVTPATVFNTYADTQFHVPGSTRVIREAEGAPEAPQVTASEGLAHSCNAVLVQIGLRVPAPILRGALVDLGYGQRPGAELGPEMAGHLTPLDARRATGWTTAYTHASVAFGHEIGVTLWQHAEALATVARGGLRRSLRLLTTVEQGQDAWQLELEGGRRVLSKRACDEVRAMMNLGATIGTGDKIAHPAMHPDLAWIGTKTGTTEKVPTEMCLHVELPALAQHSLDGTRMTAAERRTLATQREHFGRRRATCYTSSMCAIGRMHDGRELMVLIVVEDPTGPEKFGSMVAGPTAVAVLRRALGLPRKHGEALAQSAPRSIDLTPASFSTSELPWAEQASAEATPVKGESRKEAR